MLARFGQAIQILISSIYELEQNKLKVDEHSTFCQVVSSKFTPKNKPFNTEPMKTKIFNKKKVKISAISSPLLPHLIKDNKEMKKGDIRKNSKPIKIKSYI